MKNRKYKHTLMMAIPFMLMGFSACQEYEHPAVIEWVDSLGPNDPFLVLRDLENDSIKIYYWNYKPNLFSGFQPDDTVDIVCRKGLRNQEARYQTNNIISWRDANILVDGPTFAKRNPDNPIMQKITRGRISVR